MRRRLELYFQRRNCLRPDELADETLNRITRRLDEEGTITAASPAHYCYIVAKLIFHEYIRKRNSVVEVPADDAAAIRASDADDHVARDTSERLLTCLEECLETVTEGDRELIIEYYRGEQRAKIERRRVLASRLGLSMNALSIRACRLRDKLEACIKTRMGDQ